MRARLTNLWDNFRSSLWFVPTSLSLAVIVLAVVMVRLDIAVGFSIVRQAPWAAMAPSAARAVLSAIAGAMVTSTSLVFSITIVAVSIAASQFGSRLIRTFRNNRVTHWTLGAFVATSLYCLLLLVVVREGEDAQFVPYLAVYLGILFAICCLGILIYFIHDTAVSVQAPSIVGASARDLDSAVERLFPFRLGEPSSEAEMETSGREQLARLDGDGEVVLSTREGYVQAVDTDTLMDVACEREIVVELLARPGTFLTRDLPLAKVWSQESPGDDIAKAISATFITGSERTPRQDVKYAVNELVEVAVRALSPGINDPFTAMNCVDRLGAAVGRLAKREIPSAYRYDKEGHLRILARPFLFDEVLDTAFNQIRQHARSDVSVTIRLLTAMEAIAIQVQRQSDREAVLRQTKMLWRGCEAEILEANDRQAVQRQFERVKNVLANHLDKDESVKQDGAAPETVGTKTGG